MATSGCLVPRTTSREFRSATPRKSQSWKLKDIPPHPDFPVLEKRPLILALVPQTVGIRCARSRTHWVGFTRTDSVILLPMEYDMPIMSISEKGQVVIPKELRDKYGIATDGEVMVTEVGGHIAVLPAPKDPIKALRGSVKLARPVSEVIHEFRNEERQREERLMRRFVRDHASKSSKKQRR